jgi:hypothetical protein
MRGAHAASWQIHDSPETTRAMPPDSDNLIRKGFFDLLELCHGQGVEMHHTALITVWLTRGQITL